MSFQKQLNQAIKESGLTAKEISEKTGISQARISDYRHGGNPSQEYRDKLTELLGLEIEEPKPPVKVFDVRDGAALAGMGLKIFKKCLREGLFDVQVGIACPGDGGQMVYTVFEKRLKLFLEGKI